MGKWLKKYMRIEHLQNTLKNYQIFLSTPEKWTDKNDTSTIEIYRKKLGIADIRATCFTSSADRYHFWKIYGAEQKGVCLWFDRESLIADISDDQNLRAKYVKYFTPDQLGKKCNLQSLPFAKREQYRDEQEFRVIREYSYKIDGNMHYFKFTPASLKKIYFNSWLTKSEYNSEVIKARILLPTIGRHIVFRRSRVSKFMVWVNAAKSIG